ncbi:MAG: DUF5320 family protein [Bacteroidota bacterium]|nr:DUF5320 family protein [Bacteroidota bacterium]
MPRFNRKGPEGEGPMTGRKQGKCSGNNITEESRGMGRRNRFRDNDDFRGQGRGAGNSEGAGRGLGRDKGRGLGRGRSFSGNE